MFSLSFGGFLSGILEFLWEALKIIWDVIVFIAEYLWIALVFIWDMLCYAWEYLWIALDFIWDKGVFIYSLLPWWGWVAVVVTLMIVGVISESRKEKRQAREAEEKRIRQEKEAEEERIRREKEKAERKEKYRQDLLEQHNYDEDLVDSILEEEERHKEYRELFYESTDRTYDEIDYILDKYGYEKKAVEIATHSYWMGQTAEELRDSRGRPDDIDKKVLKTKKKEIWKYDEYAKGRYKFKFTLENDVVVGYETN